MKKETPHVIGVYFSALCCICFLPYSALREHIWMLKGLIICLAVLSGAQGNNYLVRTAQIQVEMRTKAVVLGWCHIFLYCACKIVSLAFSQY